MKKIMETFRRRTTLMETGVIYVEKDPVYGGAKVTDEKGEWYGIGEMVRDLLEKDIKSFFNTSDGEDAEAMQKMQTSIDKNVQGGVDRWDSDVFPEYYNVSIDSVVELWAKQNGVEVQVVEPEPDPDEDEGYDSDGSYESSNPFTSLEEKRS